MLSPRSDSDKIRFIIDPPAFFLEDLTSIVLHKVKDASIISSRWLFEALEFLCFKKEFRYRSKYQRSTRSLWWWTYCIQGAFSPIFEATEVAFRSVTVEHRL